VNYLARYTHRIAISNGHRQVTGSSSGTGITGRTERHKTLQLEETELITRFQVWSGSDGVAAVTGGYQRALHFRRSWASSGLWLEIKESAG